MSILKNLMVSFGFVLLSLNVQSAFAQGTGGGSGFGCPEGYAAYVGMPSGISTPAHIYSETECQAVPRAPIQQKFIDDCKEFDPNAIVVFSASWSPCTAMGIAPNVEWQAFRGALCCGATP